MIYLFSTTIDTQPHELICYRNGQFYFTATPDRTNIPSDQGNKSWQEFSEIIYIYVRLQYFTDIPTSLHLDHLHFEIMFVKQLVALINLGCPLAAHTLRAYCTRFSQWISDRSNFSNQLSSLLTHTTYKKFEDNNKFFSQPCDASLPIDFSASTQQTFILSTIYRQTLALQHKTSIDKLQLTPEQKAFATNDQTFSTYLRQAYERSQEDCCRYMCRMLWQSTSSLSHSLWDKIAPKIKEE